MRLLYTASDGSFKLTKDNLPSKDIPPYAILSHTWGEQEVVFDDLKNLDSAKDVDTQKKASWNKIRFCAQQAKRDGLEHFWIDTCCIDKSNSQELQESINSMFRWYQNANQCYVYLSDVECNTPNAESEASKRWKPAFRKSRWFTRGWTLQELLAPASVGFYSKEGDLLGDKQSLKDTIHEITGIPIEALQGSPLSDFGVTERFSWAEDRKTTREEDSAYCLLGIFDICMTLRYTEGKERAINRLRQKVEKPMKDIEKRRGEICKQLSAPDPSTNYHRAHKQRQADTGLWLLEGEQFTSWKEIAASRLWLYGIPGCGKTILSSTIIEHLQQHCHENTDMAVAYFYFDFNDAKKQDPELMLSSLLCQLLQRSVVIPIDVDALFLSCENRQRQLSLHVLIEAVQQMVQEFEHVYIVVDALDECTKRTELMDILETVSGWQLDNMHLLVTSRKERDIESSLENYINEENTVCLQEDVVDQDIRRYVQQRLHNDKSLAKWNQNAAVRQEIEAALTSGAHGMFRWAVCQLDTLGKCLNRAMLRKSLLTLPKTLDQTYARILSAIDEEQSEYARRILQWLTFSERPLSVEEIAEVVAIDVAGEKAFNRDEVLEDPLEALNICSSLVTITETTANGKWRPTQQFIVLAHYSVKEYLVSDRIRQGTAKQFSMQETECHSAIARGCLKYLLQLPLLVSRETIEGYVLAKYTAQSWSSHLRKTGDDTKQVSQLAMRLMDKKDPACLNWIRLCNPDHPYDGVDLERGLDNIPMPLYFAALLGLSTITRLLLDQGADVNVQGGSYGSALQAASGEGHDQVVKMLLNQGADVNVQGGHFGNALQAASYTGNIQIVEMLLNQGADVNMQGGWYGNALQAASYTGNIQIVEMLLNQGADVNMQGGWYGNALQAASSKGHSQIVKMLLNQGANVNVQGGYFDSALQAASWKGRDQVVKMLLDKGAIVDESDRERINALVGNFRGKEVPSSSSTTSPS